MAVSYTSLCTNQLIEHYHSPASVPASAPLHPSLGLRFTQSVPMQVVAVHAQSSQFIGQPLYSWSHTLPSSHLQDFDTPKGRRTLFKDSLTPIMPATLTTEHPPTAIFSPVGLHLFPRSPQRNRILHPSLPANQSIVH